MKIRPAGSMHLLSESMERVAEIPDRAALMAYLQEHYDFWSPTEANVTANYYCKDDRIGWDTWLICVDGHAAVFSDGEPPP